MTEKVIFFKGKDDRPISKKGGKVILPKFSPKIGEEWEVRLEDKGNYYFAYPVKKVVSHQVNFSSDEILEISGEIKEKLPLTVKEENIVCPKCNEIVKKLSAMGSADIKVSYPQWSTWKEFIEKSPDKVSCLCNYFRRKKFENLICPLCEKPAITLDTFNKKVKIHDVTLTLEKLKEHFIKTLEPLPDIHNSPFTYAGETGIRFGDTLVLPDGTLFNMNKDTFFEKVLKYSNNKHAYGEDRAWESIIPELDNNFEYIVPLISRQYYTISKKLLKDRIDKLPKEIKTIWFDLEIEYNPTIGSCLIDLPGGSYYFPTFLLNPKVKWKRVLKDFPEEKKKHIEKMITKKNFDDYGHKTISPELKKEVEESFEKHGEYKIDISGDTEDEVDIYDMQKVAVLTRKVLLNYINKKPF